MVLGEALLHKALMNIESAWVDYLEFWNQAGELIYAFWGY